MLNWVSCPFSSIKQCWKYPNLILRWWWLQFAWLFLSSIPLPHFGPWMPNFYCCHWSYRSEDLYVPWMLGRHTLHCFMHSSSSKGGKPRLYFIFSIWWFYCEFFDNYCCSWWHRWCHLMGCKWDLYIWLCYGTHKRILFFILYGLLHGKLDCWKSYSSLCPQ